MESRNCLLPPPAFYTNLMHSFHIVSYPVYIFTLITLLRNSSNSLHTYKYYILGHIVMNMISESFVSFTMLPIAYLSYAMLRTTGRMARFGFSGLFQFYILTFLVSLTVGSILEMLYFRFKVCIVQYKEHTSFKVLRFQVNVFRFLTFFPIVYESIGFPWSIEGQQRKILEIYEQTPSLPAEFTCYSCVIALLTDWVTMLSIACWTVQLIVALSSFGICLFSVWKFMQSSLNHFSKETMKLQKMLLLSLFIQVFATKLTVYGSVFQVTIHATLIGIPVFFMIFAMFYDLKNDDFGLILLLLLAYHGFVSTCAMIFFTKPLRDEFLPCLKKKTRVKPRARSISQSHGEGYCPVLRSDRDFSGKMNLMHSFHVVSYPIYLITLTTLLQNSSKLLRNYKYYIVGHVVMNVISESFVSFAMLPTTHLPFAMLRTTGWMAQLGFSGLVQFYILTSLVCLTMGSILEMLYFRFKLCIAHHKERISFKVLRVQVNIFRVLTLLPIVYESIGFPGSLQGQQRDLLRIYKQNPSLPPEFTCYSSVIALFDWVTWVTTACWLVQLIVSLSSFFICLFSMWSFMQSSVNHFSKDTTKLQKMLLLSLFVQITIHATLIGVPFVFMIYALFVGLDNDNFALILLLLLAYHGFVSTCAMILFTKPLREKFFPCLKKKAVVKPSILSVSSHGKI